MNNDGDRRRSEDGASIAEYTTTKSDNAQIVEVGDGGMAIAPLQQINDDIINNIHQNNITDEQQQSQGDNASQQPQSSIQPQPPQRTTTTDAASAPSYDDDGITTAWSVDSDGRPVSMPHSWHPSTVGSAGASSSSGANSGQEGQQLESTQPQQMAHVTALSGRGGMIQVGQQYHHHHHHPPMPPGSSRDQYGYPTQPHNHVGYGGGHNNQPPTQSHHHHGHGGGIDYINRYNASSHYQQSRRHPQDVSQYHHHPPPPTQGYSSHPHPSSSHHHHQGSGPPPPQYNTTVDVRQDYHPPPITAATSTTSSNNNTREPTPIYMPKRSPPEQLLPTQQRTSQHKGCSCRKTKCLKLYCQCFASSVLCSAAQCICDDCQNTQVEFDKGSDGSIAQSRRQVLVRNPNAFKDKFLDDTVGVVVEGGGGGRSSSSQSQQQQQQSSSSRPPSSSMGTRPSSFGQYHRPPSQHHMPGGGYAPPPPPHHHHHHQRMSVSQPQQSHQQRQQQQQQQQAGQPREYQFRSLAEDVDKQVLPTTKAGEKDGEHHDEEDVSKVVDEPQVDGGETAATTSQEDTATTDAVDTDEQLTNKISESVSEEASQEQGGGSSSISKPSFESAAELQDEHDDPSQQQQQPRYAPNVEHGPSWEVDHRQRGGYDQYGYQQQQQQQHHQPMSRGGGYHHQQHHGYEPRHHQGPYHTGHSYSAPPSQFYRGGSHPSMGYDQQQQQQQKQQQQQSKHEYTNTSKVHRVGCKCKKSKCLKKYCECFSNKIKCGSQCKCENCGNQPPESDNAHASSSGMMGRRMGGGTMVPQQQLPPPHMGYHHPPGPPYHGGGGGYPSKVQTASMTMTQQQVEIQYDQSLNVVSSIEEDKITTTTGVGRPSSDLASQQTEQFSSKDGSQAVAAIPPTAPVASGGGANEKKLDFLASLASELHTDAAVEDEGTKRKTSEEDHQQQLAKKIRPNPSDDTRNYNMAPEQHAHEQQRRMYEHHHQQQQQQGGYPYQQYRHHHHHTGEHPPAYHHGHHPQQQYHYQQPQHWQGPPQGHVVDPRAQHNAYPQGGPVRPQFSRAYHPQLPPHQQQPHNTHPSAKQDSPSSNISHPKNTLPKGLTYRKVCSHCGRQRAEHGEFGFGNKCPFTTCGRCGAEEDVHKNVNCSMGVLCKLSVEEGAQPGASETYEVMLGDLAARAQIQAGMNDARAAGVIIPEQPRPEYQDI